MPIEIHELNIRINVNQNQQEQDASPAQGGTASGDVASGDRDELIAACIERVMEILNDKKER